MGFGAPNFLSCFFFQRLTPMELHSAKLTEIHRVVAISMAQFQQGGLVRGHVNENPSLSRSEKPNT